MTCAVYYIIRWNVLISHVISLSQLHFKNPRSWEEEPKTSYVYVMCPWISKYQWHAFTMFPEPQKENHTMLCIAASGDWTKELHERIKAPGYRQMYVIGPFKSQFADTAVSYRVISPQLSHLGTILSHYLLFYNSVAFLPSFSLDHHIECDCRGFRYWYYANSISCP